VTGLRAWHRAPCAWCDDLAKGTADYEAPGERFGSCGKHGIAFKAFETPEQATARKFTESQAWLASLDPAWGPGVPAPRVEGWGEFKPAPPEPPARRMFIVSGRGHGKRAAQAAWLKKYGDPSIKPGDVVTFPPAGRHWGHVEVEPRRDHWMKRLFLRGR
jgi:hypothetical protein